MHTAVPLYPIFSIESSADITVLQCMWVCAPTQTHTHGSEVDNKGAVCLVLQLGSVTDRQPLVPGDSKSKNVFGMLSQTRKIWINHEQANIHTS